VTAALISYLLVSLLNLVLGRFARWLDKLL
jgi:hypothetical protein